MREIHLWSFPEDKIFVLLKDSFRQKFFGRLTRKIGSQRELARRLNIHYMTLRKIIVGKRFRNKNKINEIVHCRLSLLKKICNIYSNIFDENIDKVVEDVEKNVLSYRAHSGSKIINPKLPIKERPEIFRIIGHIIGDGTWTPRSQAKYINSSSKLRKGFIEDLNIMFGDVETNEFFRPERISFVSFPTAIIYILQNAYNIKFNIEKKFPKFILNSSKVCKAFFIQALFDDEGFVHDSNIQICSLDKELLIGLKNMLLKDFKIQTSKLSKYSDYLRVDGGVSKVYYFNIYANSIEKFASEIGVQHPKKAERLNLLLKIKNRKKTPSKKEIKKTVIYELKKNHVLTAPELSIRVVMTARNLRKHLRRLEKDKIIEKAGKKPGKGGALLWKLKEN